MDAGLFREKITIQRKEIEKDEIGQQKEVWREYCQCYAYVNGLSGSEYWEAARQNAQNTVVFTVRYSRKLAKINPIEYRVIFRGDIYDIDNTDNVQFRNDIVKIRGQHKIPGLGGAE